MNRLENVNELLTQAVLEGDLFRINLAGDEEHFLVFHIHALDWANALWEIESFGFTEWFRGVPANTILPNNRRIEALFNRRPDAKRRCKFVAFDDNVRAVQNLHFIDTAEQLVAGVFGEDVREPRFNAHANDGPDAELVPVPVARKLLIAELDTGFGVGAKWMWLRQGHGHVDVVHFFVFTCQEDGHDESGVNRVDDNVWAVGAQQLFNCVDLAGIDLGGNETRVAVEASHRRFSALLVVVSDDDLGQE